MNVKSLIETITSAITTTGLARYVINDRSFLAELLSDKRPTPSGPQTDAEVLGIKPFIDYRPTDRLPVTMLVVRRVWKPLMLLPGLCYRGAAVAAALMSGARVKRLADCPSKVRSARVNFVIFFVSLVFAIVLLLVILSFFIRGVLFFDPSQRINEHGAITMAQPCGSERNVFLYNTGQCWANTGIQVVRGDRVEVTASGAYYGRVADLYHCAKDNCVLPFDMVMPGLSYDVAGKDKQDMRSAQLTRLCMYKGETRRLLGMEWTAVEPVFGSLLYQIRASNEPLLYDSDRDADHRRMIQGNHDRGRVFSFEARHSGDLYVSVNDIYLDRRVLDIMDSCRNTAVVTSLLERYGPAMTNGQKIAMLRAGLGRKYLPEMWFADNMGEILFNITVHRNVIREANTAESFFAHVYRHIDRFFDQRPGAILLQVAVALAVIVLLLWADNRFMHRSPKE